METEESYGSCGDYIGWKEKMDRKREFEKANEWELYDIDMVQRRWRY